MHAKHVHQWLCATVLGVLASGAEAATLVADYRFNGDLTSAVAGAPNLVYPCSKNMGKTTAADALDLSVNGVATFKASTGFILDTSSILSAYGPNDYTILMRVKLTSTSGWLPLAYGSPNNSNADDGFYNNGGKLSMWNNAENPVGNSGDIVAGAWAQVGYSLKPNGANVNIAGVIGALRAATYNNQASRNQGMCIASSDKRLAFFRGYYNDITAGTVDRIQVYRGGMTTAEMAAVDLSVELSALPPTVDSQAATSVLGTSADFNGTLSSTGTATTAVTLYWGTSDGGLNAGNWSHTNDFGVRAVGSLTTNVTGLARGQTYYYNYFATNSVGSDWGGSTISFTTPGAPVVATTAASAVTTTAADANGTLTSVGDTATAAVYLCWGLSDGGTSTQTWANVVSLGERSVGPLTQTLGGLSAGTRYYYRYCAANLYGTVWGASGTSFKTLVPWVDYGSALGTIAIPDGTGVAITSTVEVAESFRVAAGGVRVAFTNFVHPYISDVNLSLISPDGTKVTFFRLGSNSQTQLVSGRYYAFADGYAQIPLPVSQWATGLYGTTNFYTSGSFNPAFVGKQAQGTWKLVVIDVAGGDNGSFYGWSLGLDRPENGTVVTVR